MNRIVEGNIIPICDGIIEGTISVKNMPCIQGILSKQGSIQGTITYPNGSEFKDYNKLINKPKIESVELIGDKTFKELGLNTIDTMEILNILI